MGFPYERDCYLEAPDSQTTRPQTTNIPYELTIEHHFPTECTKRGLLSVVHGVITIPINGRKEIGHFTQFIGVTTCYFTPCVTGLMAHRMQGEVGKPTKICGKDGHKREKVVNTCRWGNSRFFVGKDAQKSQKTTA